MRGWLWKSAAALGLAAATLLIAQQDHQPLRQALLLLREGKTAEARTELDAQRKLRPDDADVLYQIARSYLLDFYQLDDPQKRRVSLALAMEMLDGTLQRNPDHIPALRAKAVIVARAELLYYNPNLAYDLASRVAKLEPHDNAFLLDMSSWMSGEVRFTKEGGHRVPHDPLIGIDRSIDMLEQVLDDSMPFSADESSALLLMANAHSRRGNFPEAAAFYKQALTRNLSTAQKLEVLRELGAVYYRTGDYSQAAHDFYQALQVRLNPIDQWLLRLSVDSMKGTPPALPAEVRFPLDEPAIDPAHPPLLAFEDVAPKLGIHSLHGNGTVAWGDIDGDGKLDLIVSGAGTFLQVYRNDGGKFTDVTTQVGLPNVPSGYSLNLVDYDNDGWLDLFVSLNGWSGPMPDRLFHNDHGHFVDVSKKSGLDDAGSGFVSLWGDLDNDGWLDVVIANGVLKDGSVPQIYRNNRDGTFTNMTKAAGISESAAFGTIGVALGDYDKDGRLDILFNGLDPAPNRLYHNDGNWHFTEVAKKAGVAQGPHNGFVCFFVDYNNDGWPDILTTSLAPWDAVVEGLRQGFAPPNARAVHTDSNRLYRNNRDGTFTDVTFEAKLYYPIGTMGAGVADLDNDGYIDFYFGAGDPQMSRLEPNRFFRNNGNATFSDLTRYVGFARPGNKGHGVAFVDLNETGALDVFAQLGGHYPGDQAYDAFYRNLKAAQNHWLEVDLRGVKTNRFAVGVQLTARAGDLLVYREVKGSEGFGATSPYRQHLGLGNHAKIDSLELRWPSGVNQVFTNLDANQIISVREDAANWAKLK
ncbi:MAG TPA: FG-GAP-like repeat-containing protein [Candidatus Sulfopaludibacter sp.]|jgi:tetratricopeptide (TPR) repeat protein|nr:FG-GAP-like repeat-containing protein [Candidatus Sulfopaludibacter sp.]